MGHYERKPQMRETAEELSHFQSVGFEEFRRLRIVTQVRGTRAVRATLHDKSGAAALLRQFDRDRTAKAGKLRTAQHSGRLSRRPQQQPHWPWLVIALRQRGERYRQRGTETLKKLTSVVRGRSLVIPKSSFIVALH
jgi:hypothetical protein